MSATQPLICKDCWPKKANHNEPCLHAMEVYNAGLAAGKAALDSERAKARLEEAKWWHNDWEQRSFQESKERIAHLEKEASG